MRLIRENEKLLILFLLDKINSTDQKFEISEFVDEYEGGKMGSISFSLDGAATYEADLIQVDYLDSDGVEVVITLTRDTDFNLLDLDFWKLDFSKLITYPKPENLVFKSINK